MCYLVAKNVDKLGSIVLATAHSQHLAEFKQKLLQEVNFDKIQILTVSRPSAFGEFEPYRFVRTESEFEEQVRTL